MTPKPQAVHHEPSMAGGRPPIPSKLTPELQAALCECLRLGMSIEHSCDRVGINSVTFRRWKRAGAKYDDQIYVEFVAAIKRAESDFVDDNMRDIRAAAASGKAWTAAAWLLERRLPEYYAQKQIEEVSALKTEMAELKAILHSRKAAK